ncbi:hypothetical protein FJT64_022725 [Amphibalanus amphitrite]|uniref:Uncharacterized protein n=1 Tax=Amphibalanus amphitrite TaxID=1232801 RepID=A0A6A4WI02_AMPAM|nr:hypothetical protein FJT64_010658 [Amphibalanus amphitrite]KAF0305693.1 hypothetical protein FJT64_022725 [Amphibalanus amphitrite]
MFSDVDDPRQRPARDITTALMRRWRLRSMVASGLGYPDLGFEALELTSLRLPLAQTYSALEVSVPDTYW